MKSNRILTDEVVTQMVYELRKFSEAVIGGPHDRAAVLLEEMYEHIEFLRESWAESKLLYDAKARENTRLRRLLNLKRMPLVSNTADADMDELIALHNEARSGASWMWSISPLVKDAKLMQFAQEWANTMAERGRMRHSSMRDIMKLGFSRAGENIAWGQKDARTVMNAWLWSPGHRRNIMSTSYTHIGCGARKDSRGRLYWCVCFGRPRSE
jgi:uncharacterized protein YkwD